MCLSCYLARYFCVCVLKVILLLIVDMTSSGREIQSSIDLFVMVTLRKKWFLERLQLLCYNHAQRGHMYLVSQAGQVVGTNEASQ